VAHNRSRKFERFGIRYISRTVPLYRIATEIERDKWKLFRERLGIRDRKQYSSKV
jgi:hypothetical protein